MFFFFWLVTRGTQWTVNSNLLLCRCKRSLSADYIWPRTICDLSVVDTRLISLAEVKSFAYKTLRNFCFVCLCWSLTSQSTIFQSYRDGATVSWVINQYFRGVKIEKLPCEIVKFWKTHLDNKSTLALNFMFFSFPTNKCMAINNNWGIINQTGKLTSTCSCRENSLMKFQFAKFYCFLGILLPDRWH